MTTLEDAREQLLSQIGEEVCIFKAAVEDDLPSGYIVGIDGPDALDELIDQALGIGN